MEKLRDALDYWAEYLKDAEQCTFPTLNDAWNDDVDNDESYSLRIDVPSRTIIDEFSRKTNLSLSTLFQATFALTIRSYVGVDAACFGVRDNNSHDVFPCFSELRDDETCLNFLGGLQSRANKSSNYRSCKLSQIEERLNPSRPAALFNTCLNFTTQSTQLSNGADFEIEIKVNLEELNATFCSRISTISKSQAQNVISAFEQGLRSIPENLRSLASTINLFTNHHAESVERWNLKETRLVERCLHDEVLQRCRTQPHAIAIKSWDGGEWSYESLAQKVGAVATILLDIGVRPGTRIATLFSKSAYSVVALLGIMRVGATAVPLDPAQPRFRLQKILQDADVKIMLSSREHCGLLSDYIEREIAVDEQTLSTSADSAADIPSVSPETVAYILSTSGSTGQPKGVMFTHRGFTSTLHHWCDTVHWDQSTRMLQFSSFSFTPSLIEIFSSLIFGGMLIIPSLRQKEDNLTEFINESGANWAFFTPSVLNQLKPDDVKPLKLIAVGGEPLTPEIVRNWSPKIDLVNVWASTEVGLLAMNYRPQNPAHVRQLGFSSNLCRVVEPGNHHRQVPIGAVGEIVVSSPYLSEGYVNDPQSTSKSFIQMPEWNNGALNSSTSKWYKVGDLVRQNSDGSLVIAGRKDSTVKLRGQKISLPEIDQRLSTNPEVDTSITLVPTEGLGRQRLVAVVALRKALLPLDNFTNGHPGTDILRLLKGEALEIASLWVENVKKELFDKLPSHMVPTMWMMVEKMPLTMSRKLDRMAIKRAVENMSPQTFEEVTFLGLKKEMPTLPREKAIQQIWSYVLKLPPEQIPRNQSFLALGGDSLSAMAVRARCKLKGMEVSVQDIVRYSTIQELAPHITDAIGNMDVRSKPDWISRREQTRKELIDRGLFLSDEIEDAYPCTPVQQGMLLSQSRKTGDYDTSMVFQQISPNSITSNQVQKAWGHVVARHPTLRTVFVESTLHGGFYDQVVLAKFKPQINVIKDETGEDPLQILKDHPRRQYTPKAPSHDLTLIYTGSGKTYLRFHVHHTLIDGTSMGLILRDFANAYDGSLVDVLNGSYADYVGYLNGLDTGQSAEYWSRTLSGIHPCLLPDLTDGPDQQNKLETVSMNLTESESILKFCKTEEVTLPSLLKCAWATVLSAYTGFEDVCFGYLTSGRDVPLPDIQDTVGPFINMLICKLVVDSRPVIDVIKGEQAQYFESLPFQHCSLAEIQHSLGLSGERLFNTSLSMLKTVTPDADEARTINLHEISNGYPTEFDVSIVVQISDSSIRVDLSHWTSSISPAQGVNLLNAFAQSLQSVIKNPNTPIAKTSLLSTSHHSQILDWNSFEHETIYDCIHNLITAQARTQPDSPAVQSWDGALTYKQLEDLSNTLALRLISMGLSPENHVIVCSEKRLMVPVSILAILKAGGAVVCVDPAHPSARLEKIAQETSPVCILASPLHESIFQYSGFSDRIIVVDESLFRSDEVSTDVDSSVQPHNSALVLFTSGSTGNPKGMLHDHQSITTSILAHCRRLKMDRDSRLLQFSALTFDVSMTEIFSTLVSGGCLVIPSEQERLNNLELVISKNSVNWAHLTPTVGSFLNPDNVPTLKNLVLAGEPLKSSNIATWADRLNLINLYGPAEVVHGTTGRFGLKNNDRPQDIGTATAVSTWIIDPKDPERLLPIGAVGELLLEGPLIAREYLKDPVRTSEAFIKPPSWRVFGPGHEPGRFYRSGDLVRYNSDGSLFILGRRDTQIKLHGQRIELEEIECQIEEGYKHHASIRDSVVIYAKNAAIQSDGFLAAFIELDDNDSPSMTSSLVLKITQMLRQTLGELKEFVTERVPPYMVPSLFIPIARMPLLASGKIDRKTLTGMAQRFSQDEVFEFSLADRQQVKVRPYTWMQQTLASLWARVLNLELGMIGAEDNFFRLGGDSVLAMRLSALAREEGFTISVASVFQSAKLAQMSQAVSLVCEKTLKTLHQQYGIERARIGDIYPCTTMQSGLMLSSMAQPGAYTSYHVYELPPNANIDLFKKAWSKTVAKHEVLRTSIVDLGSSIGHIQIVTTPSSELTTHKAPLDQHLQDNLKLSFEYGHLLNRASLVQEHSGETYFVWTAHHAIYDDLSIEILFADVSELYSNLVEGSGDIPEDPEFSYKSYVRQTLECNIVAAEEFWTQTLSDASASNYPTKPSSNFQPMSSSWFKHSFKLSHDAHDKTISSALIGAWALLLTKYSESPDNTTFGLTLDGREDNFDGTRRLVGPTLVTYPASISIRPEDGTNTFLDKIQHYCKSVEPHQHFGLQNIKAISSNTSKACDFGSILSLTFEHVDSATNRQHEVFSRPAPVAYPLALECHVDGAEIDITARFDERILSNDEIQRLVWQFAHVLRQLSSGKMEKLRDIDLVSPEDVDLISNWNAKIPSRMTSLIQDVIHKHVINQPQAEALCSHEGSLTFAQLDDYSNRLAQDLVTTFAIGRGSFVPLAFSKSIFFTIAMLGVLKAGGAFVPMDPSQPTTRLNQIIQSTQADFVLCSPDREQVAQSLAPRIKIVNSEYLDTLPSNSAPHKIATPEDIAYVIYTSGTTGKSKGVMIPHSSFSTSAVEHGGRIGLSSSSRVIQFASFAFDASLEETLTVLIQGGCICVPRETERLEDITKPMREMKVNWAVFTPSFVRTISPEQVPQLKTLILAGERMGSDNIEVWAEKVHLINAYGPAEACILATAVEEPIKSGDAPECIGTSCGNAVWLVDPDDVTKLVPVGCVGELVIEGPTVARGYLGDVTKTESSFVDNPFWLSEIPKKFMNGHGEKQNGLTNGHTNGHLLEKQKPEDLDSNGHVNGNTNGTTNGNANGNASGKATGSTNGHTQAPSNGNAEVHHNGHDLRPFSMTPSIQRGRKVYKTGDLGKYDVSGNKDGSIRYMGRKDTQVKIRGQRVELEDIEYHIRSRLASVRHVVVEQVNIALRGQSQLTAFICVEAASSEDSSLLLDMPDNLRNDLLKMDESLSKVLPGYMIPTLYVTITRIPRVASGKLDRRSLRVLVESFDLGQLTHYSLVQSTEVMPDTNIEKILANVWAQSLNIPVDTIGKEDSFFKLGGDSIGAMRMTTLARSDKLQITVAQVFKTPKLDQLALSAVVLDDNSQTEIEPFSLIRQTENISELLPLIEQQSGINMSAIQDVLPVTPLQEGLMLLSLKTPGSYVSQTVLTLENDVDLARLQRAWREVAHRNSILRTTMVHTGQQSVQVVLKDLFEWREATGSVEKYITKDKSEQMKHGGPLTRYAVVKDIDGTTNFVLTAHHSIYDGWSMKIVFEEVNRLYNSIDDDKGAKPPQFSSFIDHLSNMDHQAEKAFWTSQFYGKSLATYPEPSLASQPEEETIIEQYTQITRPQGSNVTLSNIIRAAWGMVMAKHANTEDVYFGAILMGRNASLPNIERMTGPTITTVPICISVDNDTTIDDFLLAVKNQAAEMIPYEHTGLQNIKNMSSEAQLACNFQNLLVIQPDGSDNIESNLWKDKVLFARGEMVTLTYSLIVECRLYKDSVKIGAQYRKSELPTAHVQRILNQFQSVLHQLNCESSLLQRPLSSIDLCSPQDLAEMSQWNKNSINRYPKLDQCIHRNVESVVVRQPTRVAVQAWDAILTYEELNVQANKLAHHLRGLGVGPEVYVPVCFDKSAWAIVAMLAILKAGGGYLCLDPKHPMERKETMLSETKSKVVVVGEQYREMFDSRKYQTVIASSSNIDSMPDFQGDSCPEVKSSNTAFLVFTSGSTGVPKGIVSLHTSFCSGSNEHCKALSITSESRVLQFAAYTYDVSMGEIFSTLMQGGCVCVPTEEERLSNLAGAINTLEANWMFLTPTVAGFLKPEQVPTVKHLVLGGEHCTNDNIRTWSDKVCLINSYGPAECAVWCACNYGIKQGDDPSNLGKQIGAALWIIDPQDPNKLAPIGTVGELAVDGPTLAREYLNDQQKTDRAFFQGAKWAVDASGQSRRIYRTGDLAYYTPTGSLHIVGRKDTQVKLRGQRIELGEIEHHLTRLLPGSWYCVVEMIKPMAKNGNAMLAAFVASRNLSASITAGELMSSVPQDLKNTLSDVQVELEKALPIHMIPTAYVCLKQLPMSAGGKADRKHLRQIGESLSLEQLQAYAIDGSIPEARKVSTSMEEQLQSLWASVLGVEPTGFGKDSSFLRSGGDSISAMKLSAAARQGGFSLSVRDIFLKPKLEDMASMMAIVSQDGAFAKKEAKHLYQRFSTLFFVEKAEEFVEREVCPVASVALDTIEDVMPATDYQRWTFGCNQLKTRGYLNYFTYDIKGDVDVARLKAACKALVDKHPILRTIFVANKSRLLQVVLQPPSSDNLKFFSVDSPQQAMEDSMQHSPTFGEDLLRFYLCRLSNDGHHRLMMRISHAHYDGISIPMISEDLKRAYNGDVLTGTAPFSSFIYEATTPKPKPEAETFFKELLRDSEMTNIVSHKQPAFAASVNQRMRRSVSAPKMLLSNGITFATIMKAAWAVVLGQFNSSPDVVFGQISSGRNTAIEGIESIVGPCMNLLPVRLNLKSHRTLFSLMDHVQTQHLDMTAFETLGFQHIIENCTSWPKWTRFSSILQHTSINTGIEEVDNRGDVSWQMGAFAPDHDVSDVWIWTGPQGDDKFYIDFTYSSMAITDEAAALILDKLCSVLDIITSDPNASIPWDAVPRDPLLPLPAPTSSETQHARTHQQLLEQNPIIDQVVCKAWGRIFGNEANELSKDIDEDTPYFKIRGDLVTAAQIASEYWKEGYTNICVEDIIQLPTMGEQRRFLSK